MRTKIMPIQTEFCTRDDFRYVMTIIPNPIKIRLNPRIAFRTRGLSIRLSGVSCARLHSFKEKPLISSRQPITSIPFSVLDMFPPYLLRLREKIPRNKGWVGDVHPPPTLYFGRLSTLAE
jgi:hypothetical protein